MPLAAGTRLGPYEIVGAVGAGGMGEVYRARDARLNRDVAIKVLPEAVADDPQRLSRFTREAQTLAALNHPNIAAIYGLEGHALVMELLEGQTLRERLANGPLPVRKAVEFAVQIARGLAAAHEKGLVHRDLKPDNIFVLDDGQVKILDFGLARQADGAGSGTTETAVQVTDPGSVVGTVGYMAPEQVRGQAVDARTDLFAFGAVLYEMLSGRRAFQRDTSAETMTAILKDDPPELGGARTDISPSLDRIVRHCLEKSPLERFQTARDVGFALGALSGSTTSSPSVMPSVPSRRGWVRAAAAAALVLAALAAGMGLERWRTPPPATPTFARKTWTAMKITNARFMPDGESIVYSAATVGNVPELYVLRPDAIAPQALGLKATHLLAVSSKGELAVLTGARFAHHMLYVGTLARMTIDGAPRPWMDDVSEADWSPDGTTMAIIRRVDGQDQLEYPIGTVRYRYPGYLSDPRVSPDGAQVAFMEHPRYGDDRGFVKLVTANGTIRTLAGEFWGEQGTAWSRDGRRLFFSGSFGGSYQGWSVNVDGTPALQPFVPGAYDMTLQDVSGEGAVLLFIGDEHFNLRALLPGESAERELPWLNYSIWGHLSNDSRSLAFTDLSQSAGLNYAVAVWHIATGKVVRLGEGAAWGLSADGRWAGGYVPARDEYVLYPTGAGQPVRLNRGAIEKYLGFNGHSRWMPDGAHVLLCGREKGQAPRCYLQDIVGGAPQRVTPDGIFEAWVAPDGRTLLGDTGSGYVLTAIGSSSTTPARGFTSADEIVGWSGDGHTVVVDAGNDVPAHIENVNVATGARTFLRDIAPPDREGVSQVTLNQWLGDGYVYYYNRNADSLFVVKDRK